ncbi:MAG: ATP-dependent helicase C-terminal domain-containing protein, partial [Actinomycetota bacterium]
AVTEALVERIEATALGILPWTDRTRNLQARADLVAAHRAELITNPIDNRTLTERVTEVFGPWLNRATGRTDIDALPLFDLLTARLGWEATSIIDRLTPATITLPRGRTVTVDYLADSPRISARAQDLYGLATTPTIVDGAVRLTVELLSPANRPIQITADLGAFWTGSWQEVRKDMAGRYPKHDWPVDPSSGS